MKYPKLRKTIALVTGYCLIFSQFVQFAQAVTLATAPLATSTASSVPPNIMYVLDDSGSMAWNYLPDYVDATSASLDPTGVPTANTTAWGLCWGVSGGSPTDTPKAIACNNHTEMPFSTGNINYLAYDPAIRYQAPLHADGTSYASSSATAAHTDGFSAAGSTNLTTTSTHQVWCTTTTATPTATDPTGGGKCVENLDTTNNILYPDATHVILKTYNGVPFYFTMSPTEYCTDFTLTNCVRSTVSTSISGVTFNVPSYYRWCHDYLVASHSFSNCQGTRDPNHIIPNYLGGWTASGGAAGSPSTATLVLQSFSSGQSINSITIGGTEVLGATVAPASGVSITSIAQTLCTDINNNNSDYSCPTAPTSGSVTIQAKTVGTAPNGQQVLVSGPAATAAVNSVGKITITNPPTAGYTITGISINGNPLISSTVTSDGTVTGTAVAICNAIQSGPNHATYNAYSGDVDLSTSAPTDARWGTCNSTTNGWVQIIRIPADTVDNGQAIVITGPPPTSQYLGTITVTSTTGATGISDITLGGTSILTSKPLTYSDGTQTTAIASDIASKISRSGCTVSSLGSVVSIVGSATCNGTLAVSASGSPATGVFRVSSSGHSNTAGDLGGIKVGTTAIVGHISNATITDSTNVSANAASLATASAWSATRVASGSPSGTTYDVTVSSPADSQYNNLSFQFLTGTTASGTTGTAPHWTFPITNATTANMLINSIQCGTTDTITTGTSTTGNSSTTTDYIANLSTNASTNGLNTQGTYHNYTYSCISTGTCTLTGPPGPAACNNLSISNSGTITISSSRTNAGSAAQYSYNITGATTDSNKINSATCSGTNTITTNTVSTGTNAQYISNLTSNAGGLNGMGANSYSWSCPSSGSCTATGPAGAAACTTLSVTNDAGITATSGSATTTTTTPEKWTFNITGATTDSKLITSAKCGAGGTNTIATSTVSTGTTSAITSYASVLANDIQTQQLGGGVSGNWSTIAGGCTTSGTTLTCVAARPANGTACAGGNVTVTPASGSGLTIGTVTSHYGDPGSLYDGGLTNSRYYYQFTVSNASAANQVISSIACSGDSTDIAATNASTGPNQTNANIATRINNLATGLAAHTANSWGYACTPAATASSLSTTCTATAPTGTSCSSFPIVADASITVSVPAKTAAVTSPQWSLSVTAPANTVAGDNLNINSIKCNGTDTFNTATKPNTGSYAVARINKLATALNLSANRANSFSTSCTTASSVPTGSTCTVSLPSGTSSCSPFTVSPDASISVSTPTLAQAAVPPTWSFNITNATAANATINSATCGGTNTFNTSNKPTTGTSSSGGTAVGYINSLTSTMSALNSYTYSCTTATPSTPSTVCSVTGPVGAAACTSLTYSNDASITIGASTQTSAGSNASNATVDFSQYLTQISAFSGGYLGQSTSKTDVQTTNSGTIATSSTNMTNGTPVSPLTIPTNATGISPNILIMQSGTAPISGSLWRDVGIFHRTDIKPAVTVYNRASTRTDCAGATCTYAEELQNYANWYTYYSTRMLMAKTASTIAFSNLGNTYRVGFDDICNCDGKTCATTVQEPVAQFSDTGEVANQRTTWWSKLTASNPSCATPLRGVTAKIGRYYAHKLSASSPDPIQYSCQQNFMFLVTDGYWNESESTANIVNLSGADIGNQDSNISVSPRPFFDGATTTSPSCPTLGSNRNSTASYCRNLSDIAWYYYSTDLRTAALGNDKNATTLADVSTNNVLTSPNDSNSAQHMVFFAMGLGVDGYLNYRQDYQTAGIGDYANIVSGTTNWPAVKNLDPTGIDDLWHATVNGHGQYFSARNPASVVTDLSQALALIGARVGAASAAATSNLEPVQGDNFAYIANYFTGDWSGDLQARTIDLTSGAISATSTWSAQTMLDQMLWSTRNLFVAPTSKVSGDPLRGFNYAGLSATEQGYFNPGTSPALTQYAVLNLSNPGDITANNLVNYLSGDRSLEQDGNTLAHAQIWRKRGHVLGDIVDTQPVYVKAPNFGYTDSGYNAYTTTGTAASRKPVVFVSAEDGMLHAFNAYTSNVIVSGTSIPPGGELWAYIPTQVMANNLKLLADANYAHQFFVDGQITVGDAYFSGAWHTILVAGLGGGGKGYFALDVTDPANPVYLWEITSATTGFANLGYTYGNASINKLPSGNWSVLFTSGYNNADGLGHLYAVDVGTGALLSGFPLNTTSANLSNAGFVVNNATTDNTAQYGYAGDLSGNVWRFDLAPSALGHTGTAVYQLAHLQDSLGVAQPVSTLPLVTILDNGTTVVYVGTGEYLGTPDLSTTQVQSMYAIKDTLGSTGTCSTAAATGIMAGTCIPRTDSTFLVRHLIGDVMNNAAVPITKTVAGVTSNIRQICSGAGSEVTAAGACTNESGPVMDWTVDNGWYVDFPDLRERMNVNMNLSLGTITFATNVPASTACTSGGSAWINYIDYKTGLAVPNTTTQVSAQVTNSLIVGITVVKLPNDTLSTIITTSDNQQLNKASSFLPTTFSGQRNQWREFEVYH